MEWGNIWAILLLALIPILLGFWFLSDKFKLLNAKKIGELKQLFSSTLHFSDSQKIYKRLCLLIAVFFLVLSLMQPHKQIGVKRLQIKTLDMVFALDTSLSMLAQDLRPNRLTRAKMEISQLLDKIKGDRVALVVFAGQALVQCPLTLDYYAFKRFLSAVNVGTVPLPGTNIASAIAVSLKVLAQDSGYKVIMLITDGEAFDKEKALEMAEKAKKAGVKIYCIGIGTKEGEPIPLPTGGYKRDKNGKVVLTRLDEDLLIKIASITGGAYLRAGTGIIDVDKMYRLIAKEKRTIAKKENVPIYAEYFVYPASIALILLLCAWFVPFEKRTFHHFLKDLKLINLILVVFFCVGWKWQYFTNNKAVKLYKKGKRTKAEKILKKIRHDVPENPIINYNLGNIYYKNNKNPIVNYQIASLAQNPTLRKYAFYNLGNFYIKNHQIKKAISAYEQALLIDPHFTDARYNLELVLKKMQLKSKQQKEKRNKRNKEKQKKRQQRNEKQNKKQGQKKENQHKQNKKNKRKEKQKNSLGSNSNKIKNKKHKNSNNTNRNTTKGRNKRKQNGHKSKPENQENYNNRKRTKKVNKVYNNVNNKEYNKNQTNQQIWAILQAVSDEELSPKDINKRRIKINSNVHVDKDW